MIKTSTYLVPKKKLFSVDGDCPMPYICGGEFATNLIGQSMNTEMKCPFMIVRDTDTVCEMPYYAPPDDYVPQKINLPMKLDSTVPVCSSISAPTNTRLTGGTSKI